MIKGKAPFPFETIALAVSFSPELEFMISEAARLSRLHSSRMVFIHAGKRTGEKQRSLSSLLNKYSFSDSNSIVRWENTPVVSTILNICKQEIADLLIVGASDRENFSTPVGSVATAIATRAKCSILLLVNPFPGYRRVLSAHLQHPKTEWTLRTALYFAEKEGSAEFIIARQNVHASVGQGTHAKTEQLSDDPPFSVQPWKSFLFRKALETTKVHVRYGSYSESAEESIQQFAFRQQADLLVINSQDHNLGVLDRIIPGDVQRYLESPGCNILFVHSRLPENA